MEAFVITLEGNEYSERVAWRCVETASTIGGLQVEQVAAIGPKTSLDVMRGFGLEWTWGNNGGGLIHHSYGGSLERRVGCAMSHYQLWHHCAEIGKPILILEHDAVFIQPFERFEFQGICQINDPAGATPCGDSWSSHMIHRGPGVFPKTKVFNSGRPDGLAGNSAYLIKPHAAEKMIGLYREFGVWPNDAMMCIQFIPYLEEFYPFITRVEQSQSTTLA